jgi:hypothetical protein
MLQLLDCHLPSACPIVSVHVSSLCACTNSALTTSMCMLLYVCMCTPCKQLGNDTNGEFFVSGNKIAYDFVTSFRPVEQVCMLSQITLQYIHTPIVYGA